MIGQKRHFNSGSKRRNAWIYSSPRWKTIRTKIFDERGDQCEDCGSIGEVQLHHRKPVSLGGAIFDEQNLILLCRSCHLEAHKQIEHEKLPEWQRKLYELVDRPIVEPRRLFKLKNTPLTTLGGLSK